MKKLVRRGDNQDLCNRYRPLRFSEVVGNATLLNVLAKGVSDGASRQRAYLFHGESGCGKTTVARIMAMGLNCQKGDTVEPCLECGDCKAALAGNAMHIVEMNMARMNKKEDVESLVEGMELKSLTGRNRVYVLDETQMLTEAAMNLLLKPVEDSPADCFFFFCTTDRDRLIPALVNRLEQHRFGRPTEEELVDVFCDVYVQERFPKRKTFEEDLMNYISRKREASLREFIRDIGVYASGGISAIAIPDGMAASLETVERIAESILAGDIVSALKKLQELDTSDCTSESIRRGLASYFKDKALRAGGAAEAFSVVELASSFIQPCEKGDGIKPELVVAIGKACEISHRLQAKAKT